MRRLYILTLLLGVLSAGCRKDGNTDQSFALYYNGVSDICPGTAIHLSPSWHGTPPTDFTITRIKHNGSLFQTDCFLIDRNSGQFSIQSSDNLPIGLYEIGVSCQSDGTHYEYPDAIQVNLMKPVPGGIIVTPDRLSVDLADIVDPDTTLPTAQITTDGSNHVAIKQYLLANVYRNGQPDNSCLDWFELSPSGELRIVPGNAAFIPGIYSFDFRLTTYAAGLDSEQGLFSKALVLDVTSAPLNLTYANPAGKVEKGYGAKSAEPTLTGSTSGLRFALKEVKPDNAIGITVDEGTGVIRFPETPDAQVGNTYSVSLTVTNAYGSKDFDDVFTYSVIAFLHPITLLEYKDVTDIISGVSLSNPVYKADGDDVEFLFGDLPDALAGKLSIDPATGEVSCQKGTEIAPGTYPVTVLARNIKSEVTASFSLQIIPNPYKFTYVRWGNNLGLTPLEEYGNQWRISASDGTLTIPVVESDIPAGVPVKYKMTIKTQNSNQKMGTVIDADTGTVTLEYQGAANDKSSRVHLAVITVTVGGNSEAAIVKEIPFFVSHQGYNAGYRIEYTPFVFRVNPKTGGTSHSPVVTSQSGQSTEGFTMDYRRNIYFFRLGGPVQHLDGRPGDGKDTFLYGIWNMYFSALNQLPNTGACSPVSWYGNKNYEKNLLGQTACHVNPDGLRIVVNPDKFKDDYGYAEGVISGTMQYNINKIDPVNVGGTECFPILIWLDPNYSKE